jgi:hypothetical protein
LIAGTIDPGDDDWSGPALRRAAEQHGAEAKPNQPKAAADKPA